MLDLAKVWENISFKRNFKHIPYEDKISRSLDELMATDPSNIIKRWWKEWDDVLWGIFGWKIYLVGAETGAGKSTFVNHVCNNVADAWHRVVRYSLEDRMEDIGKEELFYMANRIMHKETGRTFKRPRFVCGEYNNTEDFTKYVGRAYDKLTEKKIIELDKNIDVTIDDLVKLMEEECDKWTRLFAIDHLHYFQFKATDRLDLQIKNVMHRINEVARKRDVAVILVAHYKNNTGWKEWQRPSNDYFRDWSAIKQVANYIIQIAREDEWDGELSKFFITKIRWPIKKRCFETEFDLSTYQYQFQRTQHGMPNQPTVSIPEMTIL